MADSNQCNSDGVKCVEKFKINLIPNLRDIDVCINHLTELDLSSSNICEVPESVGNLVNIIKLDLSSNNLDTLPLSFIKLQCVSKLNLSHNKFIRVPQCLIEGMCSITTLDLAHNHLIDISTKPFCFKQLLTLNINNNLMLVSFPQWLWSIECNSLESLDISFTNCLDNIADDPYLNMYGISKNLKYLNVSNTNSNILKLDFIKHLKNLCTIVVDNKDNKMFNTQKNYFISIPLVFNYRYKCVSSLSMSNVSLSSLGNHFYFNVPKLRFLNLSNNAIVLLPETFGNLMNLEVCDLSNNQILTIPECFKNLKNLKELILNNNWVSEFPDILEHLLNLEFLDLYNNRLNVNPSWNLSSKIKFLDLEQNYFSTENNIDLNIKSSYLNLLTNLRMSINEDRIMGPICVDEFNDLESLNESENLSSQWSIHTTPTEDNIDEKEQENINSPAEEIWECDSYEYTTALFDPQEFELCLKNECMALEKSPRKNFNENKRLWSVVNVHYFRPSDDLPSKKFAK